MIEFLNHKIAFLNQENQNHHHKIAFLNHENENHHQEIAFLNHKIAFLNQENENHHHKMAFLNHENENHHQEIVFLNHKMQSLNQENENHHHKMASLNHKMQSHEQMPKTHHHLLYSLYFRYCKELKNLPRQGLYMEVDNYSISCFLRLATAKVNGNAIHFQLFQLDAEFPLQPTRISPKQSKPPINHLLIVQSGRIAMHRKVFFEQIGGLATQIEPPQRRMGQHVGRHDGLPRRAFGVISNISKVEDARFAIPAEVSHRQ